MNLKELVVAVSGSTGVEATSVKKVLDAAFVTISNQLATEEPIRLQGFGTFLKRPGKEGGEARVIFRLPLTEAQKADRKAKKAQAAG